MQFHWTNLKTTTTTTKIKKISPKPDVVGKKRRKLASKILLGTHSAISENNFQLTSVIFARVPEVEEYVTVIWEAQQVVCFKYCQRTTQTRMKNKNGNVMFEKAYLAVWGTGNTCFVPRSCPRCRSSPPGWSEREAGCCCTKTSGQIIRNTWGVLHPLPVAAL